MKTKQLFAIWKVIGLTILSSPLTALSPVKALITEVPPQPCGTLNSPHPGVLCYTVTPDGSQVNAAKFPVIVSSISRYETTQDTRTGINRLVGDSRVVRYSSISAPRWGGLCLDIANPEGKGPQNGAPVLAFSCHGGQNQVFQVRNDGTIRAPQWGGLCLDIANPEGKGPQNGAAVLAFSCHGGDNQVFQVSNDGTISAPQWGGLCLDIANPEGKGPQNGARVLAFSCHGGNNQKWIINSYLAPGKNNLH